MFMFTSLPKFKMILINNNPSLQKENCMVKIIWVKLHGQNNYDSDGA